MTRALILDTNYYAIIQMKITPILKKRGGLFLLFSFQMWPWRYDGSNTRLKLKLMSETEKFGCGSHKVWIEPLSWWIYTAEEKLTVNTFVNSALMEEIEITGFCLSPFLFFLGSTILFIELNFVIKSQITFYVINF